VIRSLFYSVKDKNRLFWFIFHVFIGIVSANTTNVLIFWFYSVLFLGLFQIIQIVNSFDKKLALIFLQFYLSSFEIISRMARTSPIIPDEIGKYLNFFLLLYAILISNKRRNIGFYLVILLIPGIILGYGYVPDYRVLVYNILGMINLCLGLVFFGSLILSDIGIIQNMLRLLVYSLIAALSFAIVKTPDYDDLANSLSANFDASGGFGTNQVSTAFGLAFFLVFYLWNSNVKIIGYLRIFDLLLSMLFLFQGLLTFSRGGIIGGVIGVIMVLLFVNNRVNKWKDNLRIIAIGLPLLFSSIYVANILTNGNLILRYQGETNATINGIKDKDINHITTNRYEIFLGDIELFLKNPIMGVGVSNSKYLRNLHEGVGAHVELSRLLAEHGIFGLIFFIVLLNLFFRKRKYLLNENSILYILAIIGLYTTFHAATRTFISPLIIPLILVKIRKVSVVNNINIS
jgi:hypothetical protein